MHLTADPQLSVSGEPWAPSLVGDRFSSLGLCGTSVGRGAFRFHQAGTGQQAQALVERAFPALAGSAAVFAVDWRGRQWAVADPRVSGTAAADVVFFDVSAGDVVGVAAPDAFVRGLDSPVLAEVLSCARYWDWLDQHPGTRLAFDRCLGPRTPLFLGGADDPANWQLSDIDVYWTLVGQLLTRARDLPDGARPGGVEGAPG